MFYLSFGPYSSAQNIKYPSMDYYDNSNGLSQGTVNCIHQDRYGYMWFGTQDGLNKFDGINFKVYKHDPLDSISISDNYSFDIEKDVSGNL